jgi:hypothetical protein
MLVVDVSEVKLTGEAKQYNLPPECGQLIDRGDITKRRMVMQPWLANET